jgi:hypothetical protein
VDALGQGLVAQGSVGLQLLEQSEVQRIERDFFRFIYHREILIHLAFGVKDPCRVGAI